MKIVAGVQHTDGPLQVKYWGVLTPVTPAALTPMAHCARYLPPYPQPNTDPIHNPKSNPSPKSYLNLSYLTNKHRHAECDVSAYWMTSAPQTPLWTCVLYKINIVLLLLLQRVSIASYANPAVCLSHAGTVSKW